MPKLNGHEAIQFFQKEFPRVSLIVLTGFPDLPMATSLMKNGIIDYLVKPVEKEKLLTAVAKAWNNGRPTICKKREVYLSLFDAKVLLIRKKL